MGFTPVLDFSALCISARGVSVRSCNLWSFHSVSLTCLFSFLVLSCHGLTARGAAPHVFLHQLRHVTDDGYQKDVRSIRSATGISIQHLLEDLPQLLRVGSG